MPGTSSSTRCSGSAPQSLLTLCLLRVAILIDTLKGNPLKNWSGEAVCLPVDGVSGAAAETLQLYLLSRACRLRSLATWRDAWHYPWLLSLGVGVGSAVVPWEETALRFVARHCTSVRRLLVLGCEHFSTELLARVPTTVTTVDLDGHLFFRGRVAPALTYFRSGDRFELAPWVIESAELYSALGASMLRAPKVQFVKQASASACVWAPISASAQASASALMELHLGAATISAKQLSIVLQQLPHVQWLRHYQLTAALFHLHGAAWRSAASPSTAKADALPTYALFNIDADFSHLVRWQNGGDSEPILPGDALHLATTLCPSATDVRVRFNGATSHDALAPLAKLSRLRALSAVCVTSGQRARLDFSDVAALLESKGKDLRQLELKVLEEVDIHSLLSLCPKLERLVLSGCGNVYEPSCPSAICNLPPMNHLRLLFFADGDDFSWDHVVPQCFWKAALGGKGDDGRPPLIGLFLESPRLSASTIRDVILQPATQACAPLFPHLQVMSLCRAAEMTLQVVSAMAGAPCAATRLPPAASALRYVRVSRCERFSAACRARLVDSLRAQRNDGAGSSVVCVVD